MSRGPGDTQRGLLTALADTDHNRSTIDDLATTCGISPVQTREAIRSLERGGHVVVTKGCIGWKGRGEYGPPTHGRTDDGHYRQVPHGGVPVFGLIVSLPVA